MPLKYSRTMVYGLGASLLVLFCISLVSIGLSVRDQETYPSTYVIGEFRLDSIPRVKVPEVLPDKIVARDGKSLQLYFTDTRQTLELPMEDCGVYFDFGATLQNLDSQLFTGGIYGLYNHSIIRGSLNPIEIRPVLVLRDPERLDHQLSLLKQNYDRQAVDAAAWVAGDRVDYSLHQDGRRMDLEATAAQIVNSLKAGTLGPVQVQAVMEPARISSEEIAEVQQLLGLAAGSLDRQNEETMNHLNGLKNELNGYIFKKDDTLMLLNMAAPGGGASRSVLAADGSAGIIASACADAGLFVEERADGYLVSNNRDTPVMLWLNNTGYTLVAQVYGQQIDPGKTVRLVSSSESGNPDDTVYYKEITISGQEPVQTVVYDPSGQEAGPSTSLEDPVSPDFFASNDAGPAEHIFKSK